MKAIVDGFWQGKYSNRVVIFLIMFSTGLASILYEVVLVSIVTTIIGATELSLAIVLGTFLLGLASGALIGGFLVEKKLPLRKMLMIIELLIALFGFSFLSVLSLFVSSGIPTHIIFWIIAGALLIPTLLMGMEIPIAVSILESQEKIKATGFVYFSDTLGGVMGALLTGLFFIPLLGFHGAMFFGAALNIFTFLITFRIGKKLGTYTIVCFALFIVFLGLLFGSTTTLQELKLGFADSFFSIGSYFYSVYYTEPVYSTNSQYQHIMILKSPFYGNELYLNGEWQTSDKSSILYHEFLTLPALASHPNPKKVLLIGGGDGGALYQLLKFNVSIDHVDLDKEVVETSKKYLADIHRGSLDDPRVDRHIGDGRRYIKETEEKYDVIIIDLPAPKNLALATLYSQEFYEEVRDILSDDGLMITQFSPPYFYLEAFACAYKTMDSVFPHTYPYVIPGSLHGSLGYIIAGNVDPRVVRNEIEGVWYDREVHSAMFTMSKFAREYLTNNSVQVSTDENPIIYVYMENQYFYRGVADDPKQGR